MFLIETTDKNGRWYVLGTENFERIARAKIRHHKDLFPHHPIRLVNQSTQRAIEIIQPRLEVRTAMFARFRLPWQSMQAFVLCIGMGLAGWTLFDYYAQWKEAAIVQICSHAPLDPSCIKRIYAAIGLKYHGQ